LEQGAGLQGLGLEVAPTEILGLQKRDGWSPCQPRLLELEEARAGRFVMDSDSRVVQGVFSKEESREKGPHKHREWP